MGHRSLGGLLEALAAAGDGDGIGDECVEDEEDEEDESSSQRKLVYQRRAVRPSGRAMSIFRQLGALAGLAACAAAAVGMQHVPRSKLLRVMWGTQSNSAINLGESGTSEGMDALEAASWDYYGGHNCYLSHGGRPIQTDEKLNQLSIMECTGRCQLDSRCEAVVMQHNTERGECFLVSEVRLSECVQTGGYDLWRRSVPAISSTTTASSIATTTTTAHTSPTTATTTTTARAGPTSATTTTTARAGPTTATTTTTARAGPTTATTTTTARAGPTTATTTTTARAGLAIGTRTTTARALAAGHSAQRPPRPRRQERPAAAPKPPEWELHSGYNCFVGHGGLPVEGRPVPLAERLSVGDCQAACEASAPCAGAVVKQGEAVGFCWLQAHVELSSCITGTDFDTWLAVPPSGAKAATSAPSNAERHRGAEEAPTAAPPSEAASGRPAELAVQEERGASANATGAGWEPQREWSVRTGLNCFGGRGARHLGVAAGAEPPALELALDDCKAQCERQEECEGVVVQPAAHLCWPCAELVPGECLVGTVYDLWIGAPRAAAEGGDGRAPAQGHARSPAEAGSAPGSGWSHHDGINCFVGAGSDTFSDGSDGALAGTRSLLECQAACETRDGCQGVTVRRGQRGDATGPCFLRSRLRLEHCLPGSEYDLWRLGDGRARAPAAGPPRGGAPNGSRAAARAPSGPQPGERSCPACAPRAAAPPTVVLPFYERDLCKAQYTARSLALHDKGKALGSVLLLWISTQPSGGYAEGVDAIRSSLAESREVEFLDLSPQVNGNGKDGWYAQQVLKLKAASRVKSEYYVVLDSKNTLMRDVDAETFLTECHQARLVGTFPWGELPKLHQEWFHRSAEVLQVREPDAGEWPASITPMIMHRQTVLDMLEAIGEDPSPLELCAGPLCGMLDKGATEFTLYLMYAQSRDDFGCTHAVSHASDWAHELAVSMWRGLDSNIEEARNVAAGLRLPTLFGAQHGALDSASDEQRAEAARYLEEIYADAGLAGAAGEGGGFILDCAVGSD